MSSAGFITWFNNTMRPPTPIRSLPDLTSMDVAHLALLITATRKISVDEPAIYAAQRKYFYFGIVDGARGSLAAHRANLRGAVLLLNDYSLLGGEDIHNLSQGLSSPDLQAYQPALVRLLDVIHLALQKASSLNSPTLEWSRLRTKLEEKEMCSGTITFPTNLIGEDVQNSVAQWPSGWEDAIQEANLSVEDINSLATLESISHYLEKSFDMVARYIPLLGLRPIEYRRHYNLDGRPEADVVGAITTSSEEERAWFASLTGAAAVYYTEVGVGGIHTVIPEVPPPVPIPSATTPQTTTPQSRQPVVTPSTKRMRSPAPPVVSRFGGNQSSSSSTAPPRRGAAPPPATPPSCTPSNRSSAHTDDGAAHHHHPVSSAQKALDYINRCEDRISDQCIKGVQPGELGCVTRHVGRFPVEKSPTDIERELLWADIRKCLTAKLPLRR